MLQTLKHNFKKIGKQLGENLDSKATMEEILLGWNICGIKGKRRLHRVRVHREVNIKAIFNIYNCNIEKRVTYGWTLRNFQKISHYRLGQVCLFENHIDS